MIDCINLYHNTLRAHATCQCPGTLNVRCTGSNKVHHSSPNMPPTRGSVQLRRQNTIRHRAQWHAIPEHRQQDTHPRRPRHLALLRTRHRLHPSHRYRRTHHGTITGNTSHNGKTLQIAELQRCTSQCDHPIFCQRHDTRRQEQCLVSLCRQRTFSSCRLPLFNQQGCFLHCAI